jgi:hypothetical protein
MKSIETRELEATIASLRELRARFAADAGSAVRQLDLTIEQAELELQMRRQIAAISVPNPPA